MNRWRWSLIGLVGLTQVVAQRAPLPSTYQGLQEQVKALSDTARFSRLADFAQAMQRRTQFAPADSAVAELQLIARQTHSQLLLGKAYMALAYLERAQNKPTQAIAAFQKAQVVFGVIGAFGHQILALQRIDGVYLQLRDLPMAQRYCEQALSIARSHQLTMEIANLYTDLATLADLRHQYRQALVYNAQAIQIYRARGEDYSGILLNQGIVYKNAGLYSQSVATYQQCLKLAQQHHDAYLEGFVYLNLPNTLVRMKRFDEAERYIRRALAWVSRQPDNVGLLADGYETLTAIYEQQGQYQQALAYHKQWVAYRDRLLNAEKSRQLIEMETRFQTRDKQQQIQRLDQDNVRQQHQVWGLVGGVSLLALLLGVSLWQYRTIRRINHTLGQTNHTLSQANQRILDQSGQLKELMRELHHRVKNNLAIVSSLLFLQSNRLEDANAVRAVREGQLRVEALSLIHQQLYQTDNVTRVSLPDYIGDLVRGLMQSFSPSANFELILELAPLEVDVELAVPLGLIVNELVTNAFKHAYDGVLTPRLRVSLWETDQLYLTIEDNGGGIDIPQWQKPGRSFGKRLIMSLVKQTGGRLKVTTEGGTCFWLSIPPVSPVPDAVNSHSATSKPT